MMVETLTRELRFAVRRLVKERAFLALAAGVIALGICGVATMFSVVNGVMLRGFSFPNAGRLVSVNFIDPTTANFNGVNGQVSAMDYLDLAASEQSFERVAAYLNGSTVNMTVDGSPRRYTGAYVTEDFLPILGVAPAMGRGFTPEDNRVGADKVAIIGHGIWQRDFGAAPDILGKVVRLNGKSATIIGVMPQGFAFPVNEELWIPLFSEFPPLPRNDPRANSPAVVALIKRDVSLDQANAEVTTIAARLAAAYPQTNKQFATGRVEPLIDTFTGAALRGTLMTMLLFCVGVLLIACVNVMNMQFARATLRAKELAIRSSLGGRRARLVAQMLTESLIVAGLGAVIGIVLASFSIHWLSVTVANFDNPPPSWMTFDLDGPVLAVTVLAMLAATAASGLLPAWMSSRADMNAILREGGRGNTNRAVSLISRGLVVVQVVVTCVLLVGALLQVRSILAQQAIDFRYDTHSVMAARMGLMDGDYPTSEARQVFYDRLLQTLRDDPQFAAVGLTTRFRMVFGGASAIEIEGHKYVNRSDRPITNFDQVSSGFFDVTAQRLVSGRAFTDEDSDVRNPVAVVDTAFAARHFGSESPLGRRFRTVSGDGSRPSPWRTIVGVVTAVRMLPPFNNPGVEDAGFYVPFSASPIGPAPSAPVASQFATVVVKPRAAQDMDAVAGALRRVVAKADPNLPLYFVSTPGDQIEGLVAQNWVIATMFSAFGLVAVVLAAVGIYGVMSFSVNQRRQEFGVRMAHGATTGRILSMVLRQGALQVTIGLVLGFGLVVTMAALMGDAVASILFGVTAWDAPTYLSVLALVVATSLVATLVPARRATRVDPMIALRAD
jgi:putative ABC transport system permease protein